MRGGARYRLPSRARRALAGLVPVVCPEGAVRLRLTPALLDHVELTVGSFPALLRTALVAGLTTYDLSAAGWPRSRGRRASRLDREAAEAWFARWWKSRLVPQRELVRAVKSLLCLAYYESPVVKEEMGYRPQAWIDKVARRRLEVYGDAIARHQEALLARDPLPCSRLVRGVREAG